MAKVAIITLARCWKCSAVHGQVVTLSCGHHFCITCLNGQHDDWTEGCKQPCQACFRLTVPKKTDIRNLTVDMDIPDIGGLSLTQSDQPALTGGADDKLRPCRIWEGSPMSSDTLREKAVLAAIEAVQKYDGYYERAQHVWGRFKPEEGGWFCSAQHEDTVSKTVGAAFSYYGNNKLWFKVGTCYFDLRQCKP